ncbi:hypothetical protein BaRGS_00040106 [Batillaria attramentaria]|uniref:TNF receptor-associated factor n=1 Tax=Batillaria attramentaria TaxID=370345 RepID=A0ABD0J1V7_9CAEN
MFPDRGINREMSKARAKCPNDMCVWAGRFIEYVKHEAECKHQPMVCEKCQQPVSRNKLDQHKNNECPQRSVKCEHCQKEMAFVVKEQHLKEECQKVPESCPQCSTRVPREKMRKHTTQDCPQRTVACPLDDCSNTLPLERYLQHLQKNTPKHLLWCLTQLQELHDSVNGLTGTEKGASGGGAGASQRSTDAHDILKAKIEQLEESIQNLMRTHRPVEGAVGGSDEASGGGATASASAGAQGGLDRVSAMEFKVNSLEPILSVLHGEMNRCIGAIEALEQKLQRETVMAQEFRQKIEQYEQTISTMSNTITQRDLKLRELENRLSNLSQDQPDGTLLWRITNFSKVRQEAIQGNVSNIHSRPFYTGPIGYKMCVRLYPNGDGMGKGTHLSLFFTLMRSNHDALLPWPFKQKVYFMLIDQNFKKHIVDAFRSEPNSSSFKRPESEMNIATGCPLFMALSKLNAPGHGYLKDDTMYIRIVVETDGLEEHSKQFEPRNVQMANAP